MVPLTTQLPHTSYHCGIHVHLQAMLNPSLNARPSGKGRKALTPGLICDFSPFALPTKNCDFSLLTRPQRQPPKEMCLGCKTTRSVTSFWPASPSVYSSPSLGGPLLFSWVLLWLTQLLSSKCSCVFLNLRSCSHPPGKNYVNHPCRFWRGGLSSIGIDDSFFYSCFLNLL